MAVNELSQASTLVNEMNLLPFLRWAGGKRRLVPILSTLIPESFDGSRNRYFEPFIGGGSFMLALGQKSSTKYVPGRNVFINDSNPDLAITYCVIRDNVRALISELEEISFSKSKNQFETIKKWEPRTNVSKAARFIYLNKTCFNGLWRVNSKGEFNVPWGKLKNPKIFEAANLVDVATRLRGATITNHSFISSLELVRKGDLVYLDPPYIPISASSSFSKYSKHDFGILEHYALSGAIKGLTERGALVILSNSNTPISREIFGEHLYLHKLNVSRSISAKSSSRNKVSELIGTNFKTTSNQLINGLSRV